VDLAAARRGESGAVRPLISGHFGKVGGPVGARSGEGEGEGEGEQRTKRERGAREREEPRRPRPRRRPRRAHTAAGALGAGARPAKPPRRVPLDGTRRHHPLLGLRGPRAGARPAPPRPAAALPFRGGPVRGGAAVARRAWGSSRRRGGAPQVACRNMGIPGAALDASADGRSAPEAGPCIQGLS